ncbi:MAG: pyruvate carboxylase subunit A [Thermofilum sp. ex4484_82]|nr:MAG: pyruvate carboxylase subunit A [Thermofilum sp. ex4484_82]OYT36306.1 MAG: pyruvate carboxylase subunit A [Archaeoglobales archaeon ex4484_92]
MPNPPFTKILIANRGEIAVRIIRAAKEEGIKTVAVYSDADRNSLHRLMADESVWIGGPHPQHSYLDIEKIIEAARKTSAEAVHPGYGFLAENPMFAKRLEEEGITFIGPPSRVLEIVGDKLGARKLVSEVGVPIAPGTLTPVTTDNAEEIANKMGYPVIVKPSGGGGGIGMTIVRNEMELLKAVKRASELAKSTFVNPEVYIEKYFPEARHIEVQILADKKGNIVHLFERECSVQRRFQKLIEESPSPALDEEKRERITTLALKVAGAVGYVNAGTVEFLYIADLDQFYFLEVNSRIQVEHPVTEMVTGVDIVKEQFRIAAGDELNIRQNEIRQNGHAFEARIYAEDPLQNFMPSPGIVTNYLPPTGPGVRVDSCLYPGYEVPAFYDPLISKLIVWGRDRREAIKRMKRALEEMVIEGIKTNIIFHEVVFRDEAFISGNLTTNFISEREILEKIKHHKSRRLKLPVRKDKEGVIKQKTVKAEIEAWRFSAKLGW